MITFPELGRYGRLGNQLFQIATTVATALRHGDEPGFPRWEYEGRFFVDPAWFHESLPDGPVYEERKFFAYEPIPYRSGLELHGYFQTPRYWEGYEERVRSMLAPAGLGPRRPGWAAIHVRRGDYLAKPTWHNKLSLDYYALAIEALRARGGPDLRFLVFSDDPDWCAWAFPGFEVDRTEDPVAALARMVSCGHHILANSSFSWWGAYLASHPDQVVMAPEPWVGPAAKLDTRDLCPASWIQLRDPWTDWLPTAQGRVA